MTGCFTYIPWSEFNFTLELAELEKLIFSFCLSISSCGMCIFILALQRKEEGEFPFGIEDLQYYVKRVEEQQFNLDFGVVKQYFPVNLVLSGIFKICQDLFGNLFNFYFVELLILLNLCLIYHIISPLSFASL